MEGSWTYPVATPCNLPQKAATAFSKATQGIAGANWVPVYYVGSQLVAGTNYCIICRIQTVTNPPVESCKAVTIYEDLEGNCAIMKVDDVIA